LEANWAEFFYQHKIVYAYEPEGFDLKGVWYLPDFYLPELRTIVEVKGVMDEVDRKKIVRLKAHCDPDETWDWDLPQFMMCAPPSGVTFDILTEAGAHTYPRVSHETLMALCKECRHWYFYNEQGSFACRCCGAHDGHHHIAMIHGPDCISCGANYV
jgi:hypothetical protein